MAGPARRHALPEQAREHDRRPEVDLEGPVDLVHGEVEQVAGGRQRRVGDEGVDVGAGAGELLDRGAVGQIDGQRPAADLGRQGLEDVGATAREDEGRAGAVEVAGQRVADPARGAGEQNGTAAEVHTGKTATVAVKP